jgi:hypothetical protein
MPDVRFSFEPSDIVNQVMSFGSPTPVEVAISGPSFADNRAHADKVYRELAKIPALARFAGGTVARLPDDPSQRGPRKSRLGGPDAHRRFPRPGHGDVVQPVRDAQLLGRSEERHRVSGPGRDPASAWCGRPTAWKPSGRPKNWAASPLKRTENGQVLVRDVATIEPGTMPGQFDRYNMRRQITLTANIAGADLGTVSRQVAERSSRRANRRPECASKRGASCLRCKRSKPD